MGHLKELRVYLQEGYNINNERPFVCDGSPYKCQVFLVGINPAFGFETSFWDYWNDRKGFDLCSWIADFKSSRQNKGKRELTPTRRNIEDLRSELKSHQISCLDLNLYLKPTSRANELSLADKNTEVFQFLVSEIKPRLVFLHGEEPMRFFQKKFGLKIEKNKFYSPKKVQYILYATNHLSYQTSHETIQGIAEKIKQRLIEKDYGL